MNQIHFYKNVMLSVALMMVEMWKVHTHDIQKALFVLKM